MVILGVSAFYHDSAACLIHDGEIIAAASEERFSRRKHDASLPLQAMAFCLKQGALDVSSIDAIAYYEVPVAKAGRQLTSAVACGGFPVPPSRLDPLRPVQQLREALGYRGAIQCIPHHVSHAASAYYCSGFSDACVLVVDAVGEWATTTLARGQSRSLHTLRESSFPNSIGIFFSAITAYLGFEVNDGEYKVMGLAAYGRPRYFEVLAGLVLVENGVVRLNDTCVQLCGSPLYSRKLVEVLGHPAREPGEAIEEFHRDIAASAQRLLEELMLSLARCCREESPSDSLCLAGGVALNCVANGRLFREAGFKSVFVQPAAGDAGGALGCALALHYDQGGGAMKPLRDVFLGPSYSLQDLKSTLSEAGLRYADFSASLADFHASIANLLADGLVVGWFQGRMEFGPRALGARSILADPRPQTMLERINRVIKRRESFRPFAPAVLKEDVDDYFDGLPSESPYMLFTGRAKDRLLHATTHVDGTSRVQTVCRGNPMYELLLAFKRRTGCSALLNTSFNVKDEPIVCKPGDAVRCFLEAGLDVLALGPLVVQRAEMQAPLPTIEISRDSTDQRSLTYEFF